MRDEGRDTQRIPEARGVNLFLTVKNRQDVLYEGAIRALSSWNQVGKFDVLELHANFIALIEKGMTIHEVTGNKKEMDFDIAILKVTQNRVDVFLGVERLLPETSTASKR